jgi:hypothetical protein
MKKSVRLFYARSSAREVTGNLVGTWQLSRPLQEFFAHGTFYQEVYH